MNYDLAKELKDAGFPQEPFWQVDVNAWGGSWYYLHRVSAPDACGIPVFADPDDYKAGIERGDVLVKMPSLEELINACGNFVLTHGEGMEAYRLELLGGQVEKSRSWAAKIASTSFGEYEFVDGGETPEEAVARLWLRLHNREEDS
jgi:hypothetical protein